MFSQKRHFSIPPEDIPSQLYTGNGIACEPEIILIDTLTGDTLINGTDYTVTYQNNTAPGKATAVITGIGNYKGSLTADFTVYCEHNYVLSEHLDATCTESGYDITVCSICKDSVNTSLPALGHTEGEWVTAKESTVYVEGLRQKYCSVCGELLSEEAIEKLIFYGDADNSGAIDSADLSVIRIAVLIADTAYSQTADANADGTVDIRDLIRLKRYLARQVVPLGASEEPNEVSVLAAETAYLDSK